MSVHYKFKSALEYDTVTFDGLHISVRDLKNAIMQQKRIGKNTDFDLQVTNAQSKEVYEDDEALIPKNTSLLIARIPSTQVKPKTWEGYGGNASPDTKVDDIGPIAKTADLSKLDASEEDKIRAMMSQSTQDYDPSNYMKIRGANQVGAVPPNYRCFKCHQGGHWIKDCPLSQGTEPIEIKKSTGIPRSFMVPVEGPQVPGAMMTPNGSFAVPVLDHQAYNEKPQPAPPEEKQPEIPEDLVCSICSDLLTDAVMIPCCGNSFCDECIRSTLLDSEDHECPDCHERDISPTTLIPNRFLRNAVANFKNTTGYVKRLTYKPPPKLLNEPEQKQELEPEKTSQAPAASIIVSSPTSSPLQEMERPVISEADSTETSKLGANKELIDVKSVSEGPPGVSPIKDESPRAQPITTMANVPRGHGGHHHARHKTSHDRSPRRPHHPQKSPSYKEPVSHIEDRPGTPTVDEPGGGLGAAPPTNGKGGIYSSAMQGYPAGPPPGVLPPVSVHPPVVGTYRSGHPTMHTYQGPPPNFRMPPPIANPPSYISGPYSVPPRPMYDGDRPPPYSNYPSSYRSSRGRDYIPRDSLRRGRTPPGVIDDPLEAFNRMLKEKDERERRAKQRKTRSYSRSSSRSYSRSPVPRRGRSRSPRRRMSRSRSRSFSISRSRSRSFSPSPRGSPPPRDYSPRGSPRHRGPSRYRSPLKSPTRGPPDNYRDRGYKRDPDRDREFRDRGYSKDRDKDYCVREPRNRDYMYYDNYERDRGRKQGPPGQWNQPIPQRKDYPPGPPNPYFNPDLGTMHVPSNRYHPRDDNPPHHLPPIIQPPPSQPPPSHMQHMRSYDDIAPPGIEQPPVPGLETTPKYDERYPYDNNEPPSNREHISDKYDGYERNREERNRDDRFREERKRDDRGGREREERNRDEKLKDDRREREEKGRDERGIDERSRGRDEEYSEGRSNRRGRHSRSPDKLHGDSGKTSKGRSPEKYKRRKRDDSSDRDRRLHDKEKSRKREASDDKKSKEKKKRKDKKESDKKKRREKKEKKEHDKEKLRKTEEHEFDDERKKMKETFEEEEEEEYQEVKETAPPSELKSKDIIDKTHFILIETKAKKQIPEEVEKDEKPKHDLYGDILNDGVDNNVIQTYGRIKDNDIENQVNIYKETASEKLEEPLIICEQKQTPVDDLKDFDDSEKDILEIHTNESDLKTELELKSEVLAPLPEKSKWEVEDDSVIVLNDTKAESKSEKSDKPAKVTNEVLKRAENAIFAKAINAIRPIEIKKISIDRVKLYSGERDGKERRVEEYKDTEGRNIQVTIPVNYDNDTHSHPTETKPVITQKPRLSVKERLGVKVDDLDRIIQVERNRSRSLSPFSRRANYTDRNLGHGERRVQLDERRRRRGASREQHRSRHDRKDNRRDRNYYRSERPRRDSRDIIDARNYLRHERKARSRSHSKKRVHESGRSKHKKEESSSRSSSSDRKVEKRKKKDKKDKKREKSKKHHKGEEEEKETDEIEKTDKKEETKELQKPAAERRKSTIDEANFEPDYDLETESENEDKLKEEGKKRSSSRTPDSVSSKKRKLEKRRDSSTDSSSSSTSEEERKKKKHKKRKKKKSRKDSSSSSSSESDSESSGEERDRKRRKHKKKQKKRKKSKK